MSIDKMVKQLEKLGYKVIPPGAQGNVNPTGFSEHSPRVQEALRRTINNGLF